MIYEELGDNFSLPYSTYIRSCSQIEGFFHQYDWYSLVHTKRT